MAYIQFSSAANSSINFNPASPDMLVFDSNYNAAQLSMIQMGSDIRVQCGPESVTLLDITIGQLQDSNFLFTDGSVLRLGTAGMDSLLGGGGNDMLVGGEGVDHIQGSWGADNIDLSEITPARDTVVAGIPDSHGTGSQPYLYDTVSGFDVSGTATNDQLNLPSKAIAANVSHADGTDVGSLTKHSIAGGIVSFEDTSGNATLINANNLNAATDYLEKNLTTPGQAVAFQVDTDNNGQADSLFVFQDGGGTDTDNDVLIKLAGVTGVTLGASAGPNVVQIVDTTGPRVTDVALTGNGLSLSFSETVSSVDFAGLTLQKGSGATLTAMTPSAQPSISSNSVTVATNASIGAADYVLVTTNGTTGYSATDSFGNQANLFGAAPAGFGGAIAGSGGAAINLSGQTGEYFLEGGQGNDTLTANNNGDDFFGNAGNDTLIGGSGDGWIEGGTGADNMNGGAGAEEYTFTQGDSTPVTFNSGNGTYTFTGGADIISGGFTVAATNNNSQSGDRIHLRSDMPGNDMSAMGAWNNNVLTPLIPADGLATDQGYFLQRGNYSNGVFTNSASGADTLVVYDGNSATGAVSQTALVVQGVIPSQLATNNWGGGDIYLTAAPAAGDTTAPAFQNATVNGSTLTLTYNEALGVAPATGAFTVNVGGSAMAVNSLALSGYNNTTLTLTLASAVTNGQTVTVSYTDPSSSNDANAIQDVAGNDAISLTNQTVTNYTSVNDTTPPVFTSGETASVAENIATSATVYDATADNDIGVTYTLEGLDAALFNINASSGAMTFKTSPDYENPADSNHDNNYSFLVRATDAAYNSKSILMALTVTDVNEGGGGGDTTAPTLQYAQISHSTITLTYDEALGTAPATNAFAVSNGSQPVAVNSASVSGNQVTLNLAQDVSWNNAVTVSYTDPTGSNDINAIQDAAGNDAISLSLSGSMTNTQTLVIGGEGANTIDLSNNGDWNTKIEGRGGNDTIIDSGGSNILVGGEGVDHIVGRWGADSIDLAESTHATDTVVVGYDGSSGSQPYFYDTVAGFDVSGTTTNDQLNLPSKAIAANVSHADGTDVGSLTQHSIADGILSFEDTSGNTTLINANNLNAATDYLEKNLTNPGQAVAFQMDTDNNGQADSLFVFQDGGGTDTDNDVLIKLAGVTGVTLGTTAGQNIVKLVDNTGPEANGASMGVGANASFTVKFDEPIQVTAGQAAAGWTALQNGAGFNIVTGATVSDASMLTLQTDVNLAAGDYLYVSYDPASGTVRDLSGNAAHGMLPGFALGGPGDTTIDLGQLGTAGYDLHDLGGNNTLTGSAGDDSIDAPDGNDVIHAGAGNDSIYGGAGADTLDGGSGADEFSFTQGDSTPVSFNSANGTYTFTGGADVISGGFTVAATDNNSQSSDRIHLRSDMPGNGMSAMGSWYQNNFVPATPTDGLAIDQGYFLQRGSYNGSTFTNSANSADTLVVYDGDSAAGAVSQTALVIQGVNPTQLIVNNWGGDINLAIPDTTPPTLLGATINGADLSLYYDETLDGSDLHLPSSSNIAVHVNGAERALSSMWASYNNMTLTLSSPVTIGDTVSVSYIDPTAGNDANAIQDAAGNDAMTFTSMAVTNNTAAQVIDDEPAGGITTSAALAIDAMINGAIEQAGDHDWFQINLVSGITYQFDQAKTTDSYSYLDSYLQLRDSSGIQIAYNDDGGENTNSRLIYTPAQSGTYYLDAGGFSTSTGNYTLSAAINATFIYHDSFSLGMPTETVGANLNGQAVETSSAGPTNWTSVDLYSGGTNTFAQSNGNGYITPNTGHTSSLASLPCTLGSGIYQASANLFPEFVPSDPGYLGVGFFMRNSGAYVWQAGTTSLMLIFDGSGGWSLDGATGGAGSELGVILSGSVSPTGWSSTTPPKVDLSWDTIHNTVSGSIGGVSLFSNHSLTGTGISPAQVLYVGIARDAALGSGSVIDNFQLQSTMSGIAPNTTPHFNLLNGTPIYVTNGNAVVLDSDVQIADTELAAINNYAGASLTLARHGGTNAQDVFSNSGTPGALAEGGNLGVNGITIGTVTTNSGGTLTLTFNSSATQNLVNAAMQQIAYSNSSSTPPASAQIDWTFSDGNNGAQGSGGMLAAIGSTTVSITAMHTNYDSNLVVNGNAEAVPAASTAVTSFQGWATDGNVSILRYGADNGFPAVADPGPTTRGNNFFYGGLVGTSSASQNIDISFAAADIDTHSIGFSLSAWLGGFNTQQDWATVRVNFYDAASQLLDSSAIGPVSSVDRSGGTGLLHRTASAVVPANARSATVTMEFTRISGSYNDGYVDDVSLVLTQASATNNLPTGSVSISGAATQGQTLTAANTLADFDGLGSIAYQWQSSTDGTNWANLITGATLTLAEAQVGKQVRVQASYTDGHSTMESVASSATAAVANVNDAPAGSVTITGTATQGQTLAATNTLADIDGLGAIAYQWQASTDGSNWANLGAGATLTLAEAQVGKQVRVQASYTDGHSTMESVASPTTLAVASLANRMYGTDGADTLTGTSGRDIILAYGGDDTVNGGAGDDLLDGGAGVDTLTGGAGNDTYVINTPLDRVIETAGNGTDSIRADIREDKVATAIDRFFSFFALHTALSRPALQTPDNVENFFLDGNARALISGNDLDNQLTGNSANNALNGMGGNDILRGGGGQDTLTGGTGADTFVLDRTASLVAAIADYNATENDRIGLASDVFGGLFDNAGAFKTEAFTTGTQATTAQQRLLYDALSGALRYDQDGSGACASVQIATLTSRPTTVATSTFIAIAGS